MGTMKFYVQTRWGGSEECPSHDRMVEIIQELEKRDREHPDTWLGHESGWTLTLHEKGVVIWNNPEKKWSRDRHIKTKDKELMLRLWVLLSNGKIDEINEVNWEDGDGIPPQTDEERRETEAAVLNWNKKWYDTLGPEIGPELCAEVGCGRLRIKNSVMCRPHHFEMIRNFKSPFTH